MGFILTCFFFFFLMQHLLHIEIFRKSEYIYVGTNSNCLDITIDWILCLFNECSKFIILWWITLGYYRMDLLEYVHFKQLWPVHVTTIKRDGNLDDRWRRRQWRRRLIIHHLSPPVDVIKHTKISYLFIFYQLYTICKRDNNIKTIWSG